MGGVAKSKSLPKSIAVGMLIHSSPGMMLLELGC
jgi:hypothetical protein